MHFFCFRVSYDDVTRLGSVKNKRRKWNNGKLLVFTDCAVRMAFDLF